jgi:hypothetical protein
MSTSPSRRIFQFAPLLFLLLVLPVTSGPPAAIPGAGQVVSDPLAAVRARFAPDRRVTVFDLTVEHRQDEVVLRGEVESAEARNAALEALAAAGERRVVDQVTVLPDSALGDRTLGLVRVSVANVRAKPSHSAELVTQTLMGWPVRLLKQQSGWYLVHTEPEGYLGWIEELQLTQVVPDGRRAWDAGPRVVTTVPYAVLRDSASPDAEPVSDLVIGSVLQSVGRSGGWMELTLPDGRRGFAPADQIQDYGEWEASRAATGEAVDHTARMFMGVPYLWGGTSSKGFDCSGFVKVVLHLHGVELPRDADQQTAMGEPVAIDAKFTHLQKGDLLFFGAAATGDRANQISHVGIYEGNLEFIHASGLVRRSSFDPASPIYSQNLRDRLRQVRRVLPGPTSRPE